LPAPAGQPRGELRALLGGPQPRRPGPETAEQQPLGGVRPVRGEQRPQQATPGQRELAQPGLIGQQAQARDRRTAAGR
jgi:hypothetical protein